MADPTIILDNEGEVVRMTNEEGNLKISQVMEARDSKGTRKKIVAPTLNIALTSPMKTWLWNSRNCQQLIRFDIMNGSTSTPSINEAQVLEAVSARS